MGIDIYLKMIFQEFYASNYPTYPKYLDILTSYHVCPKFWASPFYYLLQQCRSWFRCSILQHLVWVYTVCLYVSVPIHRLTSNGVFWEDRCSPPLIFIFTIAVTLKIRSRSPKSKQFFVMSQLYIHEKLVRIQPLVHKILCRQDSVMPTQT